MTEFLHSEDFGKELCEAMGLNPNEVLDMTIHLEPGELVHLHVNFAVPLHGRTRSVLEKFFCFRLVKPDQVDPVTGSVEGVILRGELRKCRPEDPSRWFPGT